MSRPLAIESTYLIQKYSFIPYFKSTLAFKFV
nr:MAG TPA: hypothetical protein [Caudoviricetes sp.]